MSLAGGHTYRELSEFVGLSLGEVHNSVARLRGARLIGTGFPLNRSGALEFLIYGVPYSFPATFSPSVFGPGIAGVLTGARMLGLKAEKPGDKRVVWPCDQGTDQGIGLAPLSQAFVRMAALNPELHRLLAMVDVLRIGKPRETKAARELLQRHFAQASWERSGNPT